MSSIAAIRTSPHIHSGNSVAGMMYSVVLALLPAVGASIYLYGLSGIALIVTCILTCLLVERLLKVPVREGSALLTGLLLALCLPPGLPVWMAVFGCLAAILLGKWAMGGLGNNIFNPALVGRAILQACFPLALSDWTTPLRADRFSNWIETTWTLPFLTPVTDGVSAATPLGGFKFSGLSTSLPDLLWGTTSGSLGESSGLLLAAGGIWLIARRKIDWRLPLGVLGSLVVVSALSDHLNGRAADALRYLFSGGIMLGAFFMATDPVTCPLTKSGRWIYALLIGSLVALIRAAGGLPEGVMYAILLGNAAVPLIDAVSQEATYGQPRWHQRLRGQIHQWLAAFRKSANNVSSRGEKAGTAGPGKTGKETSSGEVR